MSDRERQILCDFTYMWNLKTNKQKRTNYQIVKHNKQKQSFKYGEQMGGCQVRGRKEIGEED